MRCINNMKGFTILELIIVIVLIGILIPLFSNFIVDSFELFNTGLNRMNTNQRAEIALDTIAKFLRSSDEKPNKKLDSDNDTLTFSSYNKNGIKENITIELSGSEDNYNLLLDSKLVLENVIYFEIEDIDGNGTNFKINLKYNTESLLGNNTENEKFIIVHPKNLDNSSEE